MKAEHYDLVQILEFEVKSSLWAGYISNQFLQSLVGKYYARKVKNKRKRIKRREDRINFIKDNLTP